MATEIADSLIRVDTLEQLQEQGVKVVHGGASPVAVFFHNGEVFAVDNRCPHMGFPLHRGTVKNGLLTCHWHEARFDLCSGCTFDLWADDVLTYETTVEDGIVYVSATPTQDRDKAYYQQRLLKGIEQNVGLVQAKSLLGLLAADTELKDIVAQVADYAGRNLHTLSDGLTRLTCVANLYPYLDGATAYHALYYAIRKVAEESSMSVPRRERGPLEGGGHAHKQLKSWLKQWVLTRHRDAVERTILAAIRNQWSTSELADLVFGGANERIYADQGHLFDGFNKTMELVDLVGSGYAEQLYPLLMPNLTQARGAEEASHWHHPVDIITPLREMERSLPELLKHERVEAWNGHEELIPILLGEDPLAIIESLGKALSKGAPVHELAKCVAYAAAMRLARFAISNEVTDWFNPQHTFIFANAVYQAVLRSPTPDVARAVFHAAISVYMDRYLDVPPAKLPEERGELEQLPEGQEELLDALLALLDRRAEIDGCAGLVSRYLRLGHPVEALLNTLTYATVREDLDFHSLQVLEAGARQYPLWEGRPEAEHILIGVVRNLAAHCPTRRAGHQTATIAQRLHRGDKIHEADE